MKQLLNKIKSLKNVHIEDYNPDVHGDISNYTVIDIDNISTYQEGGVNNSLDSFLNYYSEKERQNQLKQLQLEQGYDQKNEMYEMEWQNKRNQGFQSVLSGALGLGKAFLFQDGGTSGDLARKRSRPLVVIGEDGKEKIINRDSIKYKRDTILSKIVPKEIMEDTSNKSKSRDRFRAHQDGGEYNPKTDLYSPEYDPNEFLGIVKNDIQIAQQEDQVESQIENWLFEEDDYDYSPVNEEYFSDSPSQPSGNMDVVSKIGAQESAGNYEAINPYSGAVGKYQFVPSHWSGQIKSYMGLPDSYNREQVMEAFKRNPEAQENFMSFVTNSIYKPEAERLLPLAQKYGMDEDKVIRMLHYRGIGDTRRRLKEGDFSVSQEEKAKYKNPDVLEYLNK